MPKRSLEVRRVTFRKKRDRSDNPQRFSPADLNSDNLLDVFDSWRKEPDSIPLMDEGSDDCVMVKEVTRPNDLTLFIDTNSGRSGEEGEVYTRGSLESVHHITEEEAPTGHTRAMLYVPKQGRNALFFSEYCQRGTAGTRLIKLFKKWFSIKYPDILMETEFVLEGSEWLDHITAVKSIEMRAHRLPTNSYGALGTKSGSFSLEVKPDKGRSFSRKTILDLKAAKNVAATVFGIPELDGSGENKLFATVVGRDGRSKKVDLADEVMPHFRRTLSESGEPELSNDEFVSRCLGYAEEILSRLGG